MHVAQYPYCEVLAAPAHVHTPAAVRIIVEGEGAFTVVDGEKLPMCEGDLVLTPGGEWHDHGHEGQDPVVWLDALALPLFVYLEGSYAREGDLQARRNRPDASEVEYLSAGLAPSRQAQRARRYPRKPYPADHGVYGDDACGRVEDNAAAPVLLVGLPCRGRAWPHDNRRSDS